MLAPFMTVRTVRMQILKRKAYTGLELTILVTMGMVVTTAVVVTMGLVVTMEVVVTRKVVVTVGVVVMIGVVVTMEVGMLRMKIAVRKKKIT